MKSTKLGTDEEVAKENEIAELMINLAKKTGGTVGVTGYDFALHANPDDTPQSIVKRPRPCADVNEICKFMIDLAKKTGLTVDVIICGRPLQANPGDTADSIADRYTWPLYIPEH